MKKVLREGASRSFVCKEQKKFKEKVRNIDKDSDYFYKKQLIENDYRFSGLKQYYLHLFFKHNFVYYETVYTSANTIEAFVEIKDDYKLIKL